MCVCVCKYIYIIGYGSKYEEGKYIEHPVNESFRVIVYDFQQG